MFFNQLKKKLFFSYTGYQFTIPEAALSSLAINLLSLSMPILTLQIYDRIIKTGHADTLYVLCTGVAICISLEMVMRVIQAYNMMYSGCVFEHSLIVQFVDLFLSKKNGNKKPEDIGVFLNKLNAISKLKELHSGQALSDMIDLPFLVLFVCLIFFFGGELVLVPISLLLLMMANHLLTSKKTKRSILINEKSQKKRYGFIIDTLLGIHSVKSCGWEESFTRRFENWQSDSTLSSYNLASLSTLIYDEGLAAAQLMTILMATVGAPLVLDGKLTVGSLTACVMLSGRIMQIVQKMMQLSIRLEDLKQAYSEIKNELQVESKPVSCSFLRYAGTLSFEKVSFQNEHHKTLVNEISFQIETGHALLIESDSQETDQALIQLMFGQIPPSSGTVLLNEVAPYDLDPDYIADQIGYLPTQGQLFKGTIEENISRFGKTPKGVVYELAGKLGIEKEINKLFSGFDTEIAGINLDFIPPGIRQRISICRALGSKPKIIVFDNSEYGLDPDGYKILLNYLFEIKKDAALIFFSKDPNIEKITDQKLTLKNGKRDER